MKKPPRRQHPPPPSSAPQTRLIPFGGGHRERTQLALAYQWQARRSEIDHGIDAARDEVIKSWSPLRGKARASFQCYDVVCEGRIVGRIMLTNVPAPYWSWTLAYRFHEGRTPTRGHEVTIEAAVQAFEKSWRKE